MKAGCAAAPDAATAQPRSGTAAVTAVFVALHLSVCLVVLLLAPFPVAGFDEHAHWSYVLHIVRTGDLWPRFEELLLVGPSDFAAWTDEASYLNHPSAYYVLMSWPAQLLGGASPTALYGLRLINALMSAWAVGLLLTLAGRSGWDRPAALLFAVLIVTTPALPIIGGVISNDNLAFLGGAMCSVGVFGVLGRDDRRRAWIWIAGGLVLAGLAKLTAALLCWFFVGMACLHLLHHEGRALIRDRHGIAALMIGLLALAPYVAFWSQYGSPAPFTEGQAAIVARRMLEMTGGLDEPFGLARYVRHFLESLLMFWPPTGTRTAGAVNWLAVPLAIFAAGALGILVALGATRRGAGAPADAFLLCGVVALAAVLVIHFGFAFQRHLETGWLKGIYPRYYFPLLVVWPAACARLTDHLGDMGRWLAAALALATLAFALHGWHQALAP